MNCPLPGAEDSNAALVHMLPSQRAGSSDLPCPCAGAADIDDLKQHPFFEGVQWESVLNQDAPHYVPPPPPDDEAEGFDWDLSTFASMGPVRYDYAATGAPGLESQHSAGSSGSASSRGSPRGRNRGQRGGSPRQPVGAVSRLSSVAAALDESSLDSLKLEISQVHIAEPSSALADGAAEGKAR